MSLYIKHFGELSLDELYDLLRARQEVFFLEQKVDCEDLDGIDSSCVHAWEKEDGVLTGYLRIIPAGLSYEQPSIGRVLVREEFRRRGISRRMMQAAIEYIEREWGSGQNPVCCDAGRGSGEGHSSERNDAEHGGEKSDLKDDSRASAQKNSGGIMISAQAYLVDYYREFGFEVVSDEYLDGGIPHYKMLLSN